MKYQRSWLTILLVGVMLSLNLVGVSALGSNSQPAAPLAAPASAPVAELSGGGGGVARCFTAILNGGQEVPPNASTASGMGSFVLSSDLSNLTYHIESSGIVTEIGAHIHKGAVGVAGPIIFQLPSGSPKEGVLTLDANNASDLINGLYYANIHSTIFPGGEIRGQLVATSCYTSVLAGSNETPPNSSAASGSGAFVLSPDQTKLTYHIDTSGVISQNNAHIHKAAIGVAGPVIFPLTTSDPKDGTLTLSAAQLTDLQAGLYYVNIHSNTFPGGEIRGQIVTATCFSAVLTGAQETPPHDTGAMGMASFVMSADMTQLTYHIETSGIATEIGAHIHKGAVGVAGPILIPLPAGNSKDGTLTVTQQNVSDMLNGLLYVNIHSSVFPGGEVRGQIADTPCIVATLSGTQEVPPANSTATGVGVFALSPDQTKLTYRIDLTGTITPTLAHIHKGAVGVAGPVIFPFTVANPISGTLTLTAQNLADLLGGLYYANVHSAAFPGGEIRGQLNTGQSPGQTGTATPTATTVSTSTVTATMTTTATLAATATGTVTATMTPTLTATGTVTATRTTTATVSPTATGTVTATATVSATATVRPTPTTTRTPLPRRAYLPLIFTSRSHPPIRFGGNLGNHYVPKTLTVHTGETVVWQGAFSFHPLGSADGLWATVSSGREFSYTFTSPGTYLYYCNMHGAEGMIGEVTVTAP